jgi:methyl-accepting chemotaxis protein
MNQGVVGVEDGASRINEVKEGIAEIIESVNLVAKTIKASADKASTHYGSTMQFVETLDSMAKSVNETSSTSNDLNDSIELQAKTLKDLDLISQLMHEASDELRNISDKVKI